MLPNTMAFIHA